MPRWSMQSSSLLALCLCPAESTLRGVNLVVGEPGTPSDATDFARSVAGSKLDDSVLEWLDLANVQCSDDPRGVTLETLSLKVFGCKGGDECTMQDASASAQRYCAGDDWDKSKCKHAIAGMRERAWKHIQNLATKFMAQDVKIPSLKGLNATLAAVREPRTSVFRAGGGYASTVPCRADGGSANLYYRHIWKDAGAAIIYNMQALGHGSVTGGGDWDVNSRCDELNERRANVWAGQKPLLFTFVREPIGKFVAGYKEMSYRHLIDNVRGHKVGEYGHAANFLDLVFSGGCGNGHVLLQASNLMSGDCTSKFDFIGRLENFDEDWKRLSQEAGCDAPIPWDSDAYHHESEEDPLRVGEKMWEVLRANDGMMMQMLCWWMLPDFAVFNYEMPPECARNPTLAATYRRQ